MTGRTKELYHLLKSKGICPQCGVNEAMKDHVLCWACNANRNDYQKIRYHENEGLQTKNRLPEVKEAKERLHEKRRQEGLCFRCGKRPPVGKSKYSQCEICLNKEKQRAKQSGQDKGILPQVMRGDGLYCYRCAKPECNGTKVCNACLVILREQMLYARQFLPKESGWHSSKFVFGKVESVK